MGYLVPDRDICYILILILYLTSKPHYDLIVFIPKNFF